MCTGSARGLADAGYDIALIAGQLAMDPVAGVRVIGVGRGRHRIDRATRVVWRVFRAARRERARICHLHDPELLWAGVLLKLCGHRVVYDVHEHAPKQIMNKFWIPWWWSLPWFSPRHRHSQSEGSDRAALQEGGQMCAAASATIRSASATAEVLRGRAAASFMLDDRGARMVHGTDEVKSALDSFVKDMGLVRDAARTCS